MIKTAGRVTAGAHHFFGALSKPSIYLHRLDRHRHASQSMRTSTKFLRLAAARINAFMFNDRHIRISFHDRVRGVLRFRHALLL
ncbi:hypothetical protein [Bradyrhizobium sp. CB3481]|uniref:hypothetical protein n=1 Tax=Bradyrhizobium sp. CB3481 TaxID=3039158 RepID=UPI0024B1C667|nr:hypothetical protein [Bradyrhizobium sp. CB3481]WFU14476.1 hypothetical protein QA643_25225 [Bradyrhizobium sp. CB3481]